MIFTQKNGIGQCNLILKNGINLHNIAVFSTGKISQSSNSIEIGMAFALSRYDQDKCIGPKLSDCRGCRNYKEDAVPL